MFVMKVDFVRFSTASSPGALVGVRAAAVSVCKQDCRKARVQISFEDEGEQIEDLARVFDPPDHGASEELPNLEELGV